MSVNALIHGNPAELVALIIVSTTVLLYPADQMLLHAVLSVKM